MQQTMPTLNDPMMVFQPSSARQTEGGYFLRITKYSKEIEEYIWRFHEAARSHGAIIEGGLPNPDPNQIQYFRETLGTEFQLDRTFIEKSLSKWMPRRSPAQIQKTAAAMLHVLEQLKQKGKTDSILFNCYTKYMCWLYFKMERAVALLGDAELPKLLYEGKIGKYELQLLAVLCKAGCDILLLQTVGDGDYLKIDPSSEMSVPWTFSEGTAFPLDFSLKNLRKEKAKAMRREAPVSAPVRPTPTLTLNVQSAPTPRPVPTLTLQPTKPKPVEVNGQAMHIRFRGAEQQSSTAMSMAQGAPSNVHYAVSVERALRANTNTWLRVKELQSVLKPIAERNADAGEFRNCFMRVEGAPDRLTFQSDLHKMYQQFGNYTRKLLILEKEVPAATPEEIADIKRTNYRTVEDAVYDLSKNLTQKYAVDLQPILVKGFTDTLLSWAAREQASVNKVTTMGVYLLCWIRRYQKDLFQGWRKGDLSCLIFLGGCRTDREALFFSLMACLPVDVLLLMPNLDDHCRLADERLYVLRCDESVPLKTFPKDAERLSMATTAFMAERDLDRLMYSDTGMYRDHQFSHTSTITLQTSIDEVALLWDKDLKYRPNFSTTGDTASIPVLFAKINGVPGKNVDAYWSSIKPLLTDNTILVSGLPQRVLFNPKPAFSGAAQCVRNGVLQRSVVKKCKGYPFALLRSEMQEYIFDKIQTMLDQRLIVGTFQNGAEYTIVSTVMSVSTQLVRMIQQYDFTKKNPKVLVVHTRESQASREDAILFAFLNQIGFDVVFYVPTGYQCVEQWYTQPMIVQHQAGDYVYDLTVPDFNSIVVSRSILRDLFRRRNEQWR